MMVFVRSSRAAVITAFALLIGLAPSLTTVCVGWEAARARMGCCSKTDGATTSAKADACCRDGEQRAHAVAAATLATLAPLQVIDSAEAAPAPVWLRRPDNAARSRAPEVPTYLLLAVFLR